jgi:hypothetical protein
MELMTDLNDRVVADVSVAADIDSCNNSERLNSVLLIYALADFTLIIMTIIINFGCFTNIIRLLLLTLKSLCVLLKGYYE